MARKTRQLRELEVVEELLLQGATIPCHRCGLPITLEDVRTGNVQNEHLHEHGLGGDDGPANRRFSHAARPCHAEVTHGSKATFAGSSRHRIKKATDPKRIDKFVVKKREPRQRQLTPDLVSRPSRRCARCGQPPGECTCQPRAKPKFGKMR